MKILDLDMDYFMEDIATGIAENNLGLSKEKKIKGRIVTGHNEALFFWQELIVKERLEIPFEVV